MRTSIELSDSLLAEVRKVMARRKTTLRALVEDGLRRIVREDRGGRSAPMPNAAFPGEPGFAPGVDPADLPRLIEAELHERSRLP